MQVNLEHPGYSAQVAVTAEQALKPRPDKTPDSIGLQRTAWRGRGCVPETRTTLGGRQTCLGGARLSDAPALGRGRTGRTTRDVDGRDALSFSGLVLHLHLQLTSLTLAMSSRQEEDAIMAGVAAVLGVGALIGGTMLLRRKQGGLATLLFLGGAVSLLGCLGISALLVLAQFAWH